MNLNPMAIFRPDARHHGVRRINILALRLLYALMFFMLGSTVWSHILAHQGSWQANDAMAWSVWAAFSVLAGIGIVRPLLMLPILLLEIAYKLLWLALVAWPQWSRGTLAGSHDEYQAIVFSLVFIPMLIVPWGYVAKAIASPVQEAAA